MGTLSLFPRCSLENDQIALLFDFVCVYTINLSTGECFPFFLPSPPVSVLYDSKSVLHFVQPISSPSPSYGSLLSEDFLKLSLPSARTHFTCFPYLDSILLIGGYFPLLLLSSPQRLPRRPKPLRRLEVPSLQAPMDASLRRPRGNHAPRRLLRALRRLRHRLRRRPPADLPLLPPPLSLEDHLPGIPAGAASPPGRLGVALSARHRRGNLRLPLHALHLRGFHVSTVRPRDGLPPHRLLRHLPIGALPARPRGPVSPFPRFECRQPHGSPSFASLSSYCASLRAQAQQPAGSSDLPALQHQMGFSSLDLPRHLLEVLDFSAFTIPNEKSRLPPMLDYWNFPSPRVAVSNGNSPRKERHASSLSWIPNPPPPPKVSLRRTQSGNLGKAGRIAGKDRKLNPLISTSFPPNRGKSLSAAEKRSELSL